MSSCMFCVVLLTSIVALSLGDESTTASLGETFTATVEQSTETQPATTSVEISTAAREPVETTMSATEGRLLTSSVSSSTHVASTTTEHLETEHETTSKSSAVPLSTTVAATVAATSTPGDDEITISTEMRANETEIDSETSIAITSSQGTTLSSDMSSRREDTSPATTMAILTTVVYSLDSTSESNTTRNESTGAVTEFVGTMISNITDGPGTSMTSEDSTMSATENTIASGLLDSTYNVNVSSETENTTYLRSDLSDDATTRHYQFNSTMVYWDTNTSTMIPENETSIDNSTFLIIPDQTPTKLVKPETTEREDKESVTDPNDVITVIFGKGSTKPSEKPKDVVENTATANRDLDVVTVTIPNPLSTWSPELYITFILKSSWEEFCDEESLEDFKTTISELVEKIEDQQQQDNGNVEGEEFQVLPEQVVLHDAAGCFTEGKSVSYRRRRFEDGGIIVSVYLDNNKGYYSYRLTRALAGLLQQPGRDTALTGTYLQDMVLDVKYHGTKAHAEFVGGSPGNSNWELSSGVLAGIVVGVLAALILLGVLIVQLVISRKRKRVKKMRHSSYDARYSIDTLQGLGVDNIQLTGMRKTANHWAYVNPALIIDDKDFSSNPLNFNALCNIAKTPGVIEEEFMMLPNYISRVTDIPLGAEDKNRYANVIPVPETRVLLYPGHSKDDCFNYINANFVRGYLCAPKSYIASQAPLDNTREDFWHMVFEQKAQAILMLTALAEHGSPRCSEYWPNTDGGDTRRHFGQYEILLLKRDIRREWITSALRVKKINSKQHLDVYHFWLTAWPAQGLPEAKTVIGFLLAARPYMELSMGPTIVHCSPGTGRTGALISVDVQMMSYDDSKLVDILSCVSGLRQDRAGLVQTREQYKFIYEALLEYAQALHSTSRNPSRTSSLGSLHVPDIIQS